MNDAMPDVASLPAKLLPCPFCGAAPMGPIKHANTLVEERYSVTCSDSRCLATVEGHTARRAALMWNRRLATPEQPGAKIRIPTETMEQVFARHYQRGYAARKAEQPGSSVQRVRAIAFVGSDGNPAWINPDWPEVPSPGALLYTTPPPAPAADFCDGHCTWLDHHPDCIRAGASANTLAAPAAEQGDAKAWAFSARELLQELTLSLSVNGSRMTIDHDALRSMDKKVRHLLTGQSATQPEARGVEGMVNRFLGWKLPEDFAPDCGISFKREPDAMGYMPSWPIGTNLLTAEQARAMFEYCLAADAPAGNIDTITESLFNQLSPDDCPRLTRRRLKAAILDTFDAARIHSAMLNAAPAAPGVRVDEAMLHRAMEATFHGRTMFDVLNEATDYGWELLEATLTAALATDGGEGE